MSCFDTIIAECKCPKCGLITHFDFQTKNLECFCKYYDIGDKVTKNHNGIYGFVTCDCGCYFWAEFRQDKFGYLDSIAHTGIYDD